MKIENFEHRNTDLHKFLEFCQGLEENNQLTITRSDWINMCGITIKCSNDSACFNFYEDGSFRGLLDTKIGE